jgi:site-specific DNA recombinase
MTRHLQVVSTEPERRAVIYLRVSTRDQAERNGDPEGYSIPAQREACLKKAAALGATVEGVYVDRGESARSADRPELQRMLAELSGAAVDYVIVHKIDRLARNRADDVTITAAIQLSGAQLVSVTENIDETPSGSLLHGIMSSIAEFYSKNLAAEVQKGMDQKVRSGGTNGRAPIGYLNVRKVTDGKEIRTVEPDPDRAPLIQAAFETYATGLWSLRALAAELAAQGLTSRRTANKPPNPITANKLQELLRNRYYVGVVTWRGVEYPGKHPALISQETFARVQRLLEQRRNGTERTQKHHHYLSGSLRCSRCGGRLLYGFGRGSKGVRYDYFFCINRHTTEKGCDLPYLPVEQVVRAVEDMWAGEAISTDIASELEVKLTEDLEQQNSETLGQTIELTRRIDKLRRERYRLADLAMDGQIPGDIAREKQQALAEQLEAAEEALAKVREIQADAMTTVSACLQILTSCHEAYLRQEEVERREMNQICFEFIKIDSVSRETEASPERQPIFQELRLAAQNLALQSSSPERCSGVHDRVPQVESSNFNALVELRGLEPLTFCMPCRRATNCAIAPRRPRPARTGEVYRLLSGRRRPRAAAGSRRCARSAASPPRRCRRAPTSRRWPARPALATAAAEGRAGDRWPPGPFRRGSRRPAPNRAGGRAARRRGPNARGQRRRCATLPRRP